MSIFLSLGSFSFICNMRAKPAIADGSHCIFCDSAIFNASSKKCSLITYTFDSLPQYPAYLYNLIHCSSKCTNGKWGEYNLSALDLESLLVAPIKLHSLNFLTSPLNLGS